MTNVVIASAARTAVGSFGGAFANTPAHDLGAAVLEAVVARAGIDKSEVSETILGQVRAFPSRRRGADEGEAAVIYLSPLLEQQGMPVVAVCVAHEIAHVVLGHRLRDLDAAVYECQEREVHRALEEWGYGAVVRRAESDFLV